MILAVDLETTGLHRHRDYISVVGAHNPETDETKLFVCQQGKVSEQCKELLESADTWITHNGTTFDLHFLRNAGIRWPKYHYDTLIGELCFAVEGRSDFSVSLANTMRRRLGEDNKLAVDHSDWGLNMKGLTETQVEYIKADLLSLNRIRLAQVLEAQKRGMSEALEKEQQLTLATAGVMSNGLAFDPDRFLELMQGYQKEAEQHLGMCKLLYGPGFNPNSPDQTIQALGQFGVAVPDTSVYTLMELATRDTSMAKAIMPILKYRQAAHKQSMYGPKKMDSWVHRGRLYGTLSQLGTSTMRYSSKQPNIQQIPVAMREMIGGEPGKFVVAPDYSQIEVRIKAHLTKDPIMTEALNSEDFHTFMAEAMFPGRAITPELRKTGKGGTFTLIFDGSYRAIQRAAIKEGELISDEIAQRMVSGYYTRFPAQETFHKVFREYQKARKPKRLTFPWGHYRGYPAPKATQMINNYVQGWAAIGMKEAVIEAQERGLMNYVGLLLHDEIVATSVPENEVEEYARELEDCMIEGMSRVMPGTLVKVEVKSSRNWSK